MVNPRETSERFSTTHWSLVVRASDKAHPAAAQALSALCERYWFPLYAFVRREGHSDHDSQDLTQAFFARLLDKDVLNDVDRDRGRFRTFLLASLRHFLSNARDHARARKRGGGHSPLSLDLSLADERYVREVAAELRNNLLKPARVTRARRWGMFLTCLGVPLLMALIVVMTMAPAYFAAQRNPELVDLKDAIYAYSDPFGFRAPPSAEKKAALEVYIAGRFGEQLKEPDFWKNPYVSRNILPMSLKLAQEIAERTPPPTPEQLKEATMIVNPLIPGGRSAENQQARVELMPLFVPMVVVGVGLFYIALPSILAAFIFRGGPLWRLFGLAPVTSNGQHAGRLRFGWRQIVAFTPFFAFWILLAAIAPVTLSQANLLLAMASVVFVLIGLVVGSTFLSKRSWPDVLARTWLVMR